MELGNNPTRELIQSVESALALTMHSALLAAGQDVEYEDVVNRISIIDLADLDENKYFGQIALDALDIQAFSNFRDFIDTEPYKFRKIEVTASLGRAPRTDVTAFEESVPTFGWEPHSDLLDSLTGAMEHFGKVYMSILYPIQLTENGTVEYIAVRVGVLHRGDR